LYTFILLILLDLDNDVHPNPGPREHEFSVFHVNARSVRNKIFYIEDISSESSVICITENHFDNNVSNSDMIIDSCDIFRKDRCYRAIFPPIVSFLPGKMARGKLL
jgi:hypothetical protein